MRHGHCIRQRVTYVTWNWRDDENRLVKSLPPDLRRTIQESQKSLVLPLDGRILVVVCKHRFQDACSRSVFQDADLDFGTHVGDGTHVGHGALELDRDCSFPGLFRAEERVARFV